MITSDDPLMQAAELAFAMVRFEEGAAHPHPAAPSPGVLRIGEEGWLFAPSWHAVPRAEVPAFLAALPSPAMLSPTTTRGMVALTLLDELAGERSKWGRHSFSNQQACLQSIAEQLDLTDESRLLLEFDDESYVISLAALRVWSERFGVQVRWTLERLEGDPRASARLVLMRSDGMPSVGGDRH